MAMLRSNASFLFVLVCAIRALSQTPSLADLQGSWFFHQHYAGSALFADADVPTPFPNQDYEMMKRAAAQQGASFPDSASFLAMLRENDEKYRHYRIDFKDDSTYATELADNMSKWLPEKGRLTVSGANGEMQLLDRNGMPAATHIEIKDGELDLHLEKPPGLLVFRRQSP